MWLWIPEGEGPTFDTHIEIGNRWVLHLMYSRMYGLSVALHLLCKSRRQLSMLQIVVLIQCWGGGFVVVGIQLPPLLLRDCKALQSLSLHGTLINADRLYQVNNQNRASHTRATTFRLLWFSRMISWWGSCHFMKPFLACWFFPSSRLFSLSENLEGVGYCYKLSDGGFWRIWRKAEEKAWQANRLQRDDRLKRFWWGCWSSYYDS